MNMDCIECGKPAVFKRVTQFSGEHPYCLFHVNQEEDFLEEDSYKFWERVNSNEN